MENKEQNGKGCCLSGWANVKKEKKTKWCDVVGCVLLFLIMSGLAILGKSEMCF